MADIRASISNLQESLIQCEKYGFLSERVIKEITESTDNSDVDNSDKNDFDFGDFDFDTNDDD